MKLYNIIIIMVMLTFVFTGCGKVQTFTANESTENIVADDENPITGEDNHEVFVYVCGCVNNPGVYKLDKSARICDALEAAGGVKENGAGERINQAEPVVDGQTIYVPDINETEEYDDEPDDGLININKAGREELLTLPGIGEAKAEAIVAYRDEHGSFENIEELMSIPGIKEGVFKKIEPFVKVK